MNTHVELDTLDLTLLELTGNRQEFMKRYQAWTKGHGRNGDSVVMYLTADEARTVATHFAALADSIDAEVQRAAYDGDLFAEQVTG